MEDFLPGSTDADFSPTFPSRETVRVIVVSSRQGVVTTIRELHLREFAVTQDWSDLQVEPITGKWMSVVTKYISSL